MNWETVIGLEVHAQLKTQSKIFSGAATKFGSLPNTQACAIDLGLPGTLPALNAKVVDLAIKFGLAVEAKIATTSVFARKNYFYPDLPKGYQISQHDMPIVTQGKLEITLEDGNTKLINITRAHLEEDAGKSLHEDYHGMSGIDLNRAGTPLLEIVSEPELSSSSEAVAYLKSLHTLVKYLDICDGNMQEGSFRCDANVSVKLLGSDKLGTRTEIKNINSFRFVEKAIDYEVQRQIGILESGGSIQQETRLYDPQKNETRPMRTKEEANDYRYFIDPDLLPVKISEEAIQDIQQLLPELPQAKKQRFQSQYKLSNYEAQVLTSNKLLADYFEATAKLCGEVKLTANWVMGELSAALNKDNLDIEQNKISAKQLATLVNRIADNTISGKIAKTVFEIMWEQGGDPDQIIVDKNLKQITDNSAIEQIIDDILVANPQQVADYQQGKDKLFGFFVGQAMKMTQGKASPEQVNKILKSKLQVGIPDNSQD